METKTLAPNPKRYVIGTRPSHWHRPEGADAWECNSPYCIALNTLPPDQGGPPVILEGLEPWRGRS